MKQPNNEHRHTLFAAKPIYSGDFENKIVDQMIETYGFTIKDQDSEGAITGYAAINVGEYTIYMPNKKHFPNAQSYYHILLHEVAHSISALADQSTSKVMNETRIAYYKECAENKIKPIRNTNALLDTVDTGISFKNATPATQNRALAYLREEAKVEIAAWRVLPALGYEIDKLNKDDHRGVINRCCMIASFSGANLGKEIDTNASYIAETNKLVEIMKHQLERAAKEIGLELPSKVKTKGKDRER